MSILESGFSSDDPLRVWESDGFRLTLWDTGTVDHYGKSRLAYRFEDSGALIFAGEDFCCSPLHAVDSDATVGGLLGFLSLRPGDTDEEYFDAYSPAQLAWADDRAEYLALLAYELENPEGGDDV